MLDLDGTTIPNRIDGMPSQKVIDAIAKAQKYVAVCVATGRPYTEALHILDALNITDPVVLVNGSLVIDGKSRKPLYERPFEQGDFEKITAILNQKTYIKKVTVDGIRETYLYGTDFPLNNPLTAFVWNLSHAQAEEIIEELTRIPTVSAHKVIGWGSGHINVTINHIYGTKQHGILEMAKILKIDTHEIIGIGDGPNDFPLLMACGFKVAMGNAIDGLKEIADYVAPTVEEDGVATVIEKFILKD